MRPLPDLDNPEAMALTGRRSALMSSWNEARATLRDAATECQGLDIADNRKSAEKAIAAGQRLIEVGELWRIVTEGKS